MLIYNQTITVVRAGVGTDRYHNQVLDFSDDAVTRVTYGRVSVQPTGTTEAGEDEDRVQVTTGWRVQSAAGVDIDITPVDRVEWAGRTCEVTGDIDRWPHPVKRGRTHHVEFTMDKRSG
jgi:hypothetical protein